jgi:hypothetical protein
VIENEGATDDWNKAAVERAGPEARTVQGAELDRAGFNWHLKT